MKAVFLGRFQPFHLGHREVVEHYRDEFDELAILVGSAGKSGEEKNPLGFEERRKIIHECFPGIEVEPIKDEGDSEEDNRRWAEKLERKAGTGTVISRNELVQRLVKEYTDLDLEEQDLYNPEIYSGTEVRRRIRSGEEWRYLVPCCAREKIDENIGKIKDSGRDYDFNPGWKSKEGE